MLSTPFATSVSVNASEEVMVVDWVLQAGSSWREGVVEKAWKDCFLERLNRGLVIRASDEEDIVKKVCIVFPLCTFDCCFYF